MPAASNSPTRTARSWAGWATARRRRLIPTPPRSPASDIVIASLPISALDGRDGGARKVATLVVGRDGTIQPPPIAPVSPIRRRRSVAVPGTSLVDVFGGQGAGVPPAAPSRNDSASIEAQIAARHGGRYAFAGKEVHDNAGQDRQSQFRRQLEDGDATTGSIDERDDAAAPAAPPARNRRRSPAPRRPCPTLTPTCGARDIVGRHWRLCGGSGLRSALGLEPHGCAEALRRHAAEIYGSALAGKTPDVADGQSRNERQLHRLIVGPPGSRQEASTYARSSSRRAITIAGLHRTDAKCRRPIAFSGWRPCAGRLCFWGRRRGREFRHGRGADRRPFGPEFSTDEERRFYREVQPAGV